MRGIGVHRYADFYERETGSIDLEALDSTDVALSGGLRGSRLRDGLKRTMDIGVSLIVLVLFLPVLIFTALAIRLESPGPVILQQERVGFRGRAFVVLKFRSMRVDSEGDGVPRWAAANDSRITRVGAIIRKFRIDELPQLINVLRGEMSFVGPRPERPYFVEQLAEQIPFYGERHQVKPGITGWAQLNYQYGASIDDARRKLQFDLYYLFHYSLLLDIVIILQTVRVILWPQGVR
jgi:exopolysaccharide biosynthesis polyprenyl glycosylphosphotransferase